MSFKKKYIFFLVLAIHLLVLSGSLMATHNRAGEITYRKIGPNKFEVKIVTYTKTSSPADRPELEFWYGDGDRDTLARTSIDFNVGPDIQRNIYIGTHVYPGNGTYTMYFLDENRNGGVVNIPGSVNIPFYVETRLTISPAVTVNNSPQLLVSPIDDGAVNKLFIHNPGAWDPDGDSLSYELVPCKGTGGQPIPTFFQPPASTSFSLDPITGDLIWDAPLTQGEFNVAMIIREWRNIPSFGLINIGYVTRDMQITIYPYNNNPPVIAALPDICVEAGTVVNFSVSATDPDGETVTLNATGGPLTLSNSPAIFNASPGTPTASGVFNWGTVCAHVRKSPYQMVFRAVDNNTQIQLSDLQSMNITVVGPSPKNPTATPQGNSLALSWDQSACTEAVGYKVYRRAGSFGFVPAACETGVPAYTGYSQIATLNGLGSTTYVDDNGGAGLAPGVEYCYMVCAFYPDEAESYASVEFCGRLLRDLPVITNVDVQTTSTTTGTIYVAWGKPTELDTIQVPGPYRYVLQRSEATGPFQDIAVLPGINDTTFIDNGLDSRNKQYRYQVQFWNDTPGNTFLVGTTQSASSIFLDASPGDEKNRLSWQLTVPWTNTSYAVYRQQGAGAFVLVGTTSQLSYTDDSLVNGTEYCYYIESTGSYNDTGFVDPIINKSQIVCSTPVDNEAPCPVSLSDSSDCENRIVQFSWINFDSCASDVQVFELYQTFGSSSQVLIASIPAGSLSFTYVDSVSVSGCYTMIAVDSVGNRGLSSNEVCIEACPVYELPNVFTPDGNGVNDFYHPLLPYRDVQSVEFTVYNRWGSIVFETEDPALGWNGKKEGTGEELPEGVYFYICRVNEQYLDGIRPRDLKGFIHLNRKAK